MHPPEGNAKGTMPDGTQFNRDSSYGLITLPNVVTFGRLCAVPMAFWMVLEHRLDLAFFLFVGADVSDAVDGWLARRYGGNALGAILDPVADKALLVTMYATLAVVKVLPDWLAILVVFRDVVIVGGVILLGVLGQKVSIKPLWISKLNTTLQILLVAAALLMTGFALRVPYVMTVLVWSVASSTLASGAAYVLRTARASKP
jgi:cardiolipin synthase